MTDFWEPNFNKAILKKLIERAGHNLSSSIADLVDNALDSGATEFHFGNYFNYEKSFFYFYNNGKGMSYQELKDALDVGSSEESRKKDKPIHGLFGVGMNISALRNCNSFQVHSFDDKKNYVNLRQFVDSSEIIKNDTNTNIPEKLSTFIDFEKKKEGTLIIWENLKTERFDLTEHTSFMRELIAVQIHLMITFNKIIRKGNFDIFFLNNKLDALDPMMENSVNTTKLPSKTVKLDKEVIEINSYIIPNEDDYRFKNQKISKYIPKRSELEGLYFYRNERLIQFSGWNDLISKSRLRKFHKFYEKIRIEINFSDKSDHLFEINPTKRGILSFPETLKSDLVNIIENIKNRISIKKSEKIKTHSILDKNSVWKIVNDRPHLDFENDEIKKIIDKYPDIENFLNKVSKDIPILYKSNLDREDVQKSEKTIIEFGIGHVKDLLNNHTLEQAIEMVSSRKPFVHDKELSKKLMEAFDGKL